LGINAPETYGTKCKEELSLGQLATHRLLNLLNEGPFTLTKGIEDEGIFERKLRGVERDGKPIGDILIAEGLARRWIGYRRSWCD
jgi:endonuclease YncB( thermonuclease family)